MHLHRRSLAGYLEHQLVLQQQPEHTSKIKHSSVSKPQQYNFKFNTLMLTTPVWLKITIFLRKNNLIKNALLSY